MDTRDFDDENHWAAVLSKDMRFAQKSNEYQAMDYFLAIFIHSVFFNMESNHDDWQISEHFS